MQRILSLATLAVIGVMAWLFLRGGGLDPQALRTGEQPAQSGGAYQPPASWTAAPTSGAGDVDPRGQSTRPPANGNAAHPVVIAPEGPAVRIAAYNLDNFGNFKAGKPHLMRVLADIVSKFDVIALQEIRTGNDYLIPNLVQLINQSGRRFDHVIGPRVGRTTVTEQYAFLFDTERIRVDHQSVYTISDPDDLLHREPLVATFGTQGVDPDEAFTFTLVNVHTDPTDVQAELDALAEVMRVVRRSSRAEDDIVLLGTFNSDDRHLYQLGQLPGVSALIAGVWTTTRQDAERDNLVIHQPSTTEYTGRSGVFDVMRHYNLSEQQALEVSDHFPVWAEFSIYERDATGRVASRRRSNR